MLKSVLFCHWIQLLMRSDSCLCRAVVRRFLRANKVRAWQYEPDQMHAQLRGFLSGKTPKGRSEKAVRVDTRQFRSNWLSVCRPVKA
jgi:hypothetical protein